MVVTVNRPSRRLSTFQRNVLPSSSGSKLRQVSRQAPLLAYSLFFRENGSGKLFQNVGKLVPEYTVLQPSHCHENFKSHIRVSPVLCSWCMNSVRENKRSEFLHEFQLE
jgi:hypothetical protein